MSGLEYKRIVTEDDADITRLMQVHQLHEVSQFISIGDNYFHYVTNTPYVYFYKVYEGNSLIGSIHLEKPDNVLYMDILVFPEFQGRGYGTKIIKDIQRDLFDLNYERIEVSVDENNFASLNLFRNAGFTFVSQEDGMLDFVYTKG